MSMVHFQGKIIVYGTALKFKFIYSDTKLFMCVIVYNSFINSVIVFGY